MGTGEAGIAESSDRLLLVSLPGVASSDPSRTAFWCPSCHVFVAPRYVAVMIRDSEHNGWTLTDLKSLGKSRLQAPNHQWTSPRQGW